MQLIVLGMHRSGTSSVTRLLNLAGAYFGPEGIATDPNAENPKGFWERRDVRAVCDGLLHGGAYDWWRIADFSVTNIPEEVREQYLDEFRKIVFQLDAHRPWVMKEPRLCLLLPVLRPALEAPVFVHVIREPLEIAESLASRNGFPVSVALALWEAYTVSAFAAVGSEPSVIVSYGDLLRDPVATTTRLIQQLAAFEVQGLRTPTEREVEAFIERDLHRQRRQRVDRAGYLNEQQAALAAVGDDLRLPAAEELAALSPGATSVLRTFEESEKRQADLEAEREAGRAAVEAEQAAYGELQQTLRRIEDHLTTRINAALREIAARREQELRLENLAADRRRAQQRASESMSAAAKRVRILQRSGAVRFGARLAKGRDLLRGRRTTGVDTAFAGVLGAIEQARTALDEPVDAGRSLALGPGSDEPPPIEELQEQRRTARARGDRAKVAVLAWDVGHNPFGRAHLLADLLRDRFEVELWGAQFDRYGEDIWLPLRDTTIPVHRYPGANFPEFFDSMTNVARRIDADAIYVSKPRFPGLGVGALAKELWNRPLIVDIDDFEPAFFNEHLGLDPEALLSHRDDPDLALPFSRLWTRASESVVAGADVLTVSNNELEARYGGVIVPHARDESVFDPARFDRPALRARLGLGDDDRMILFGGTPRAHKGILELLQAVDLLDDRRVRVGAFQTRELAELRKQIGSLERWIVPVPFHSFDELPSVLAAADLAVALQSPEHPVSRYQMPAKVTDAMAMGIPCLVTPVPPLQPLIDKDVLEVFDGDTPLHRRLGDILAHPSDANDRARKARDVFLESFSYEAVRPVAAAAIERHLDDPPSIDPGLESIVGVARDLYRPTTATRSPATAAARPSRRPMPPGSSYDLVVFWKQNDTGIYGRRQDMFLKYLERSGRFEKILHFDHPMSVEGLLRTAQQGIGSADQSRLVVQHTLRRMTHRADRGAVRSRTFVYGAGRASRAMKLPRSSEYVKFVRSVLEREQVGHVRPVVFWVYPTSPFFPELADALAPDIVVADVVDDNRTWYDPGTPGFERVQRNYQDVLERSDIVLANCEPVAVSMREFTPEIHVIPNACELPGEARATERPRELRGLTGPIVGYAGNLSGRIDIELLRRLTQARRDWNFVFLGSTHLDRSALDLASEPNARLIGTKRYDDAQAIISHFDVALIPHLDNEMSRSMNPLKAYVYCSLGVPIVSSPVANLDQLAAFITFADGTEEFVTAIEEALRKGKTIPDRDTLLPHSWDVRVEEVLGLVDETVERRRSGS
jgi:glycosyltransferase involved in cell wall biosynthesis